MKGKFAVWERPATGEEGGQTHVQRLTPATDSQWPRAFKVEFQGYIGGGKVLHTETAPSALTIILKLVMQWSDQASS